MSSRSLDSALVDCSTPAPGTLFRACGSSPMPARRLRSESLELQRARLTSLGPAIPLQLTVHETQFGSSFSIGRFVSPAPSNPRGFTRIRIIGPAAAHNAPKCELPSPGLIRWRRIRSVDSSSRVMKRRADTLGRTDCPEQELQTAREDRSTSPSPRQSAKGCQSKAKPAACRRSCTLCSDSIDI